MPKKCLDAALNVVRSSTQQQQQKKKKDGKMTIADTITDTTFLINYTSDSNFKLYTHNSYFAKCVYN